MKLTRQNLPEGYDWTFSQRFLSQEETEVVGMGMYTEVRLTNEATGAIHIGRAISGTHPTPSPETGKDIALGRAMRSAGLRKAIQPPNEVFLVFYGSTGTRHPLVRPTSSMEDAMRVSCEHPCEHPVIARYQRSSDPASQKLRNVEAVFNELASILEENRGIRFDSIAQFAVDGILDDFERHILDLERILS